MSTSAFADGTAAGTTISNTATATYEDPNAPGATINATSNTVTVTVAEVAGVTATPLAINDVNGGTVLPNDVLNYDYRITNVGNDPTRFFIPGSATVTGPGTAGTLQYSLDGGATFNPVPAGGLTTASIAAGGSVIVRVPVTISGLASSGSTIAVRLGDTGPNDNSAGTQNQTDTPDATDPTEIRTLDNPDGTALGEATGTPSNGEREASVTQQVLVGSQPQAFAAILKTRTAYTDSSTTALNDDVLTYGLSLRVDATVPAGTSGLSPANLAGTTINVDGAPVTRVLVSDAVPASTTLTGTPVAPAGWTVVYTNSPTGANANAANWVTSVAAIGMIGNATRIGFINNGPISAGPTVTGFTFQVVTTGVTGTTTIANLAQVFGQTQGGGTTLVYDESGDQTPSNFNDDGTVGSITPTNGVANPPTDGVDSNNNTGTGPGGEDNVFTVAAAGTILNGPNGQPGTVGPTNNNDDFTNKSSAIPANTAPGATIDPNSVTFLNTINNPTIGSLSNILLVPDSANFTPGTGEVLPPTGTTVTITYGGQTAVYTYNGTNFIFTSGSTIAIPILTAGTSVNYSVAVDLPANTVLSTDTGNGFTIPIYAFQDVDGDARPDLAATEPTQNRTLDRVYTGFLKMLKEARILDTNGTTVVENYTQTPTAANLRTGRFIEYRITYTNISIAPVGAGNVTLNAGNVVITEDGTVGTNTWARDNDGNSVIDTSNVVGSTTAQFGTIAYSPSGDQAGTTQTTDVTRYTNTLGISIQPGASGTFIFRRKLN